MGRYVTGDFEFKFWFAVQPSSDIMEFGGQEMDHTIRWCWEKDDLPTIKKKIKDIEEQIERETGKSAKHWNAKITQKGCIYASTDPETHSEKWKAMLPLLAKWSLGKEIEKVVKKLGEVYVEAEK